MKLELAVVFAVGSLAGSCAAVRAPLPTTATLQQLRGMRNADVEWHGTWGGLLPLIRRDDVLRLSRTRQAIDGELLCALVDGERFAIAHVLLAMRHDVEWPAEDTSAQWKGLRVQLRDEASYEGNDLEALLQKWMQTVKADGLTCP